ncbi:hypothetical protein [Rhodocista pekingensis]|uniref:Uncharacterized protein n=1 Tax=Rhodocista pekingensis TaxID=201185 RepID=A0ABW2L1A2_9PROT
MSERKPVEGVSASEAATKMRLPERVVTEARTREAREEKPPEPPPPPIEPSPSYRPYRVQLDPETSRLFTEVIDPRTGHVLLRIPPSYVPSDETSEPPDARAVRKEIEL